MAAAYPFSPRKRVATNKIIANMISMVMQEEFIVNMNSVYPIIYSVFGVDLSHCLLCNHISFYVQK